MTLTPDGRVTIPVDLAECKIELLGFRHSVTQERYVLAMLAEIEQLRHEKFALIQRIANQEEHLREFERKQFVGTT